MINALASLHRGKNVEPGKIGVLLVNTGSPSAPTPESVRAYLKEFLMDPRIRPMNRFIWGIVLNRRILPARSIASAEKYARIWTDEGSPLSVDLARLAEGLQSRYERKGENVVVRHAARYGAPTIVDGVRALASDGAESLVVLPLYPQSAFSTTGSVSDAVKRALRKVRWKGEATVIDDYHDHPTYIRAIAASVKHAGFDVDSNDRLMFSYHSIPLSDIEAGDTYELQSGATSLAIANELGLDRRRWTVAYQCRFDDSRGWLAPFASKVLDSWARIEEPQRTFVVCPNFSIDCLETLYDIKCELEPAFARTWAACHVDDDGFAPFTYVPCLNKSKAHLRVLDDVLAPYVEKPAPADIGEV